MRVIRLRSCVCVVLASVLALGCAGAKRSTNISGAPSSATGVAAFPATDSMPAHETFTVQSVAVGEARPVNVYTPPQYRQSSKALPVLYMPDGALDEDFPHVAHMVDSLIAIGAIRPHIVVGIPNTMRRRDLSGPTRVKSDSAIAPVVGGSYAFRKFVRDELFPEINKRYRTTSERSIVGESLAGLFVMETLLLEPNMFTHYVALDPSLWWNNYAMADSSNRRIATFDSAPRSLFIATSKEPSTAVPSAKVVAFLNSGAPKSFRVTYVPRTDLEHSNIFRAVERQALIDALR